MKKYVVFVLVAIMTVVQCSTFAYGALWPMEITGEFPDGVVNKSYYSTQDVTFNYSSYNRLEIISGSLPPGLNFASKIVSSSLTLTGTPTEEGSYTFTIRITNVDFPEATATKEFTIKIAYDKKYDPDERFKLTGEFPDGMVWQPYNSWQDVYFGWRHTSWEVIDGELPPGLNLSYAGFGGSAMGYYAELRGRPTTAGTYTFTVRATYIYEKDHPATKEFTVVISPLKPDPPDPDDDDPTPIKNNGSSGSGGGGGCNAGLGLIALLALAFRRSR